MGKKRKFNRFIRWIKSDLPEDNKSVLLLGVTKLPSPTAPRARPHTLHLDHHVAVKSQTLDAQPRLKPRLFRSHSGDSLNELLTCHLTEINNKQKQEPLVNNKTVKPQEVNNSLVKNNTPKKVSFDTKEVNGANKKRLGFCTDLPHEYYLNSGGKTNERDQDIVMDKSVDSIGSCSLDVDASSTDFSDSSVGSSDCTLRSLGIPTPTTQPQLPSFRIEPSTIDVVEPKKPSYLNLACTVNGYSNITNYDSKLRENFRTPKSREVSPIRPQEYHANITQDPNQKFLSPGYVKPMMTSPNMAENKSQTILRSSSSTSYSFSSTSSTTMSSKKFISNMIYNDNDTVDRAGFAHHTNGVQSKFNSFEHSKISHSNYSNVNGKSNGSFSETVHETYMNGQQNGQSKAKSFIQQRVERLYGPGALAQGFFISKRSKNRLSESENSDILNCSTSSNNSDIHHIENFDHNDVNIKQSSSSPSLPVLRHLRPEFRAQLPILSPKKMNHENQVQTIQKNTTVPSALTDVTTANGDEKKLILNGSKPSANLIENKENIEKHIKIPEEIPAAPQVILPEVAVNGDVTVNGTLKQLKPVKAEVKNGHYFLKILKNETDRLIALAEITEADIEKQMTVLTDDVLGYLRSASGKARLLVTQKMQQFEGLCHKNINQVEGEQFPTTDEDLQGFWDMVMLQVTQVDELFAELDRIKANNWIIEEKPKPGASETASKVKKLVIVKKTVSAEAEAARKQREAARKKMLEDRRKAMRAKQAQQPEQSIEIFVPESS